MSTAGLQAQDVAHDLVEEMVTDAADDLVGKLSFNACLEIIRAYPKNDVREVCYVWFEGDKGAEVAADFADDPVTLTRAIAKGVLWDTFGTKIIRKLTEELEGFEPLHV